MRCGVHLHVASGYSSRYGASHPADLVRRVAERGVGTLALTDHDTVTGAVRFAKEAMPGGIRPVFGADVAVAPPYACPAPRPGRALRSEGARTWWSRPCASLSSRGMGRDGGGCAAWCRPRTHRPATGCRWCPGR